MHEPDQAVLLKMPPVRVHWLKVQTENTNKELSSLFQECRSITQMFHIWLIVF